MKKLFILCVIALAGCHANKTSSPYTILKVIKEGTTSKFNVEIFGRLNRQQLLAIAGKIKSDSSKYTNLQIDYLLPGNDDKNSGGNTIYASAIYPEPGKITSKDTVKDTDDNLLDLEIMGLNAQKAKYLLALNPPEPAGKTILGKFIDDNTKTISIFYTDVKEPNQTFVLEMDTAGKVVSAVVPQSIKQNGIEKLVVSQGGDYVTIKDSILTMYSSTDPANPFRSIKAGL